MDIYKVILSDKVKDHLKKVPIHIAKKLGFWIEGVKHDGLSEVKKTKSYHDEPLKGHRAGQRSIRLSKAYRAIYKIRKDGAAEIVEVMEVNKHDY